VENPRQYYIPNKLYLFIYIGHADAYEGLNVKFISGRSPELFIKDENGADIEKIDLSKVILIFYIWLIFYYFIIFIT
jgi:hypothetical protein